MILQNKQANSRPDSHNDDDRNRLLMTMTLPNNARQKVKNEMPQQEEGRTTFMVQRTGPHFPSVATGQCPGRIGGSGEPGVPKGTQGTQGTWGTRGTNRGNHSRACNSTSRSMIVCFSVCMEYLCESAPHNEDNDSC